MQSVELIEIWLYYACVSSDALLRSLAATTELRILA